jgi:hypothetical protein
MKAQLFSILTAVALTFTLLTILILGLASNPIISAANTTDAETLLCRFGVNAVESQTTPSLPDLGAGWYMNFTAQSNPARPEGIEYVPVIRFQPSATAPGYTYNPNGAALQQTIGNNLGAKWLISNEPDSTQQDDLTPAVYARAYHELYHLIKNADPTAQVIAGSIIQATPLRLAYLDQVLSSYYAEFNTALPTDGWSIHNYILNEVSCSHNPANCWGAGIPPGINWPYGEVRRLADSDRLSIFVERVDRFRQWMANRGYRGLPVYLTEYGVLFPEDYVDENGNTFPPARVNAFMAATYDYMQTAVNPTLGDPHDEYRMVQQWAWYSTTDINYNGVLFDPQTLQRTEIGEFFADYTATVPRDIDFYPTAVSAIAFSALSQGEAVTVTLRAHVANSGNLTQPAAATVRFYNGHPSNGLPLGPEQAVSLSGCGDYQSFTITWPHVAPGQYDVYVQVIAADGVSETDVSNNLVMGQVVVGTYHQFLPILARAINW